MVLLPSKFLWLADVIDRAGEQWFQQEWASSAKSPSEAARLARYKAALQTPLGGTYREILDPNPVQVARFREDEDSIAPLKKKDEARAILRERVWKLMRRPLLDGKAQVHCLLSTHEQVPVPNHAWGLDVNGSTYAHGYVVILRQGQDQLRGKPIVDASEVPEILSWGPNSSRAENLGGRLPGKENSASADVGGEHLQIAIPSTSQQIALTSLEAAVERVLKELSADGRLPTRAKDRDRAVAAWFQARNETVPSARTVQRYLKKQKQ